MPRPKLEALRYRAEKQLRDEYPDEYAKLLEQAKAEHQPYDTTPAATQARRQLAARYPERRRELENALRLEYGYPERTEDRPARRQRTTYAGKPLVTVTKPDGTQVRHTEDYLNTPWPRKNGRPGKYLGPVEAPMPEPVPVETPEQREAMPRLVVGHYKPELPHRPPPPPREQVRAVKPPRQLGGGTSKGICAYCMGALLAPYLAPSGRQYCGLRCHQQDEAELAG